MGDLSFNVEWENPHGARGPELRATWARLTIEVNGEPITQVHDYVARSVRDGIYVPTYPLAEWIATHWWHLLWEHETPGSQRSRTYRLRHNLRLAREGFALPDLSISPEGQSVALRWEPQELLQERVRFFRRGDAQLELAQVREGLRAFVTATAERLVVQGIRNTLLQEEWSAIEEQEAEPAEEAFCKAAAALGLDPYTIGDHDAQRIMAAGQSLPEDMRQDFFCVGELGSLTHQAERIRADLEIVRRLPANLQPLKQWRDRLAGATRPAEIPWQAGYEFARTVRRELGAPLGTLRTMTEWAALFGLEEAQLRAALVVPQHDGCFFDALVAVNDQGSPGFVLHKQREDARRFALSRALYEYLTGPADGTALLTAARSDRQKTNRAFAAEFLAPAAQLREKVSSGAVSEEAVEDLANEFNVSPYVIRHQVANHGLARLLEE